MSEDERSLRSRPGVAYSVHFPEPDYSRPVLEIPEAFRSKFRRRLASLYGEAVADEYLPELARILKVYYAHKPDHMIADERNFDPTQRFTEKDVMMITYGDLVRRQGEPPIRTLADFCDDYLEGVVNTLHILPFFPSSSDRGFAVTDFETVDPRLGTWEDIAQLEHRYRLVFDGVFNHVSSQARWFREFRDGDPYYGKFFLSFHSPEAIDREHMKLIFRPRTTPLLTPCDTVYGRKWVWTTFSEDQIDLNYQNPDVLMRVLEILLLYVRKGADMIRLDAVGFLWWEPGSSGIHLDETHEIVRLFRDVLDLVAPGVALVTETNVPHERNISYFGDGRNEAQMIYNFPLPPLTLYAFYRGDCSVLTRWAANLEKVSDMATYLNFLDSHDGIGLMGAQGILSEEEIAWLVRTAQNYGALVSYRAGHEARECPYELNTTWFGALNHEAQDEDLAFQIRRFVASRAVALVLRGVPGIYMHSLIGTENDIRAVLATNSKRDINRQIIDVESLEAALRDPFSKVSRIGRQLGRLLRLRTQQPAFHPNGGQQVLDLDPRVFAVVRTSCDGSQVLLALTSISPEVCWIRVSRAQLPVPVRRWRDLVSEVEWETDNGELVIQVHPYDVLWLQAE
ncbi:MAG TPA: sugar phosphorylase [Acidobacteriota bacterium]|nr:sugar phosphorylase [Acidobacteriota bacterium]